MVIAPRCWRRRATWGAACPGTWSGTSPGTSERLGARLARDRDGLWLEGAVMESAFILKYLGEGGLDPRLHVPGRVEYLLGSLREEGITFSRDVRLVECDISAVAQLVCHTWGLPTKMPSRRLVHDWWNEQSRGYQTLEGRDAYAVSTVLHVLGACMVAPDLDDEEKRRVWTRSLRLLDERPWVELYHLSPLYSWQQVIAFVVGNAHRFPEHPTRAHEDALTLMLQLQQPCGGFQSHLLDAPNEEETGLALLALKDAICTAPAPGSCPLAPLPPWRPPQARAAAAVCRSPRVLVPRPRGGLAYSPTGPI